MTHDRTFKICNALAIATIAMACVAAILIFSGCSSDQDPAAKYATGKAYAVSGYVKKIDDHVSKSHDQTASEGTHRYSVVIETVEELPDKTHTFTTDSQTAYKTVLPFSGDPDRLVYILISAQGDLMDCSADPFSDEEVASAGKATETRDGKTTQFGMNSNSADDNLNTNAEGDSNTRKRDAVNTLNMSKRSEDNQS